MDLTVLFSLQEILTIGTMLAMIAGAAAQPPTFKLVQARPSECIKTV